MKTIATLLASAFFAATAIAEMKAESQEDRDKAMATVISFASGHMPSTLGVYNQLNEKCELIGKTANDLLVSMKENVEDPKENETFNLISAKLAKLRNQRQKVLVSLFDNYCWFRMDVEDADSLRKIDAGLSAKYKTEYLSRRK